MWFRLALALGRSVREAKRTIEYREFVEWCHFYGMEPWGAERDNMHTGIVASMIGNVNRRKGAKAFCPDDFMVRVKARIEQTPEQMRLAAMRINTAMGGRFVNG